MFRTILVPLDGSPWAEHALPLAAGIAERSLGVVRLVRVHRPMASIDPNAPDDDEDLRRAEKCYLEAQAAKLRQTHNIAVSTALLGGPIAATVCDDAQRAKGDLITLTTHGRGPISRFWLGSVTDELLRSSPVPLLVLRPAKLADDAPHPDTSFRFHRILVPHDGSEVADTALAPATELARLTGAEVTLVRVVEPVPLTAPDGMAYLPPALEGPVIDELATQARAGLDRAAAAFRAAGVPVTTQVVIHEQPATAVLEAAENADLIALASHGRGRLARLFLGSVADKVVRGSRCPVLVVRSPDTAGGSS